MYMPWFTFFRFRSPKNLKMIAFKISKAVFKRSYLLHMISFSSLVFKKKNILFELLARFAHVHLIIICRYENTIVGQFFGHAHSSFYEMFYDEANLTRPVSVVLIPGSITTYSDLNPGFRIYELDGNYTGSSWVCENNLSKVLRCAQKLIRIITKTCPCNKHSF